MKPQEILKKLQANLKEIYLVVFLLIICAVVLITWSLKSTGSHAGADDLFHTEIAKYSWKYPHLLFDHWGKPFFTLIASPFAQFGNIGTKMMNVLFALMTAFLAYLTSRKLNYKAPWMVILFVIFAPIYTVLALSGNIEIMAGLITISSVYFYSRDKFITGNIILSFGFFVRNELFIFIPFFLIYSILQKKYREIPFLLTGFVLYSIAGYFYYHDIFWVITQIPYGDTKGLIETGSLLHYVNHSKLLFGIPETILLVIGLVFTLYWLFRNGIHIEKSNAFEVFIILLPLMAYFGGHSYLHWKGTGGSGGSMRVMASIAPLAALVAIRGITPILELIKKKIALLYCPLILLILLIVIITPRKVHEIPVPDMEDMVLLRQTAEWYKNSEYYGNYLIWGDPRITSLLGIDPFNDKEIGRWYLHDSIELERFIPDNAILIWDAHFSTNFGHTKLERVMNSPFYKLIKVFESSYNYKALGGYDFAIYVFQKQSGEQRVDNFEILKRLRSEEENEFRVFTRMDFKKYIPGEGIHSNRDDTGNPSFLVTSDQIYSPAIEMKGQDFLKMKTKIEKLKLCARLFVDSTAIAKNLVLVSSFQKGNEKPYAYYKTSNIISDTIPGWSRMELKFPMPVIRSKNDVIKFYIWNQGNHEFVMDDLTVFMKTK